MKKINFGSAVVSGLIGTIVMTMLMIMAPMIGMPKMDIGKMLGSIMGNSEILGWMAHFAIGIILAGIYAFFFRGRFSSKGWLDGMIYGIFPWLAAQLAVMPMLMVMNGMSYTAGLFSGSLVMAAGSLMGHLVYGALVGIFYKPTFEVGRWSTADAS